MCKSLIESNFIFKYTFIWICFSCFYIPGYAQTSGDSVKIDQRNIDISRESAELADFEEQRANLAVISYAGDYNRNNASNEFNLEARAAVARSFYTHFADDFDFLVVFTTFEFDTANALAFFHPVRNSIEGIGRNIFDNGLLYDSQSGLQGYIDMAAYTRYELDPREPAYRTVLNTLSHEIMHRWFSGIEYVDDSGKISTDLLGMDGDHWPVYSDTQASVMGGAIWRDNGDNTHTALDSFRQYSDFDLYLAGFLPPAPEFSINLIRADGDTERLFPSLNETVSGERESITLDQLIAVNGPRIPGYDEAQRTFQLGFIILKRPGETVPDSLIQAITRVQDDFPQRFSAQTGGVGIALSHLPQSESGVAGVPATVIAHDGQTMPLDVDSAVNWLLIQQDETGFWQDKNATRVRDTAVSARFIRHARPASSAWVSGRDWLLSHTAASSDDQVWQLESSLLPGDVNSQLIADLIGQRMPDGGWGLQRRFQSSPLDTARVAASVGGALPIMISEQTYSYLRSLQNANGSWSPVNGGVSQLMTTAHAINALKLQSSNAQAVDTAVQWLRSQQREDGGYGSESSSVSTTVAVLRALSGSLPGSDPSIQNAIAYLSNRQHIDGHWEFSVHSTAQAADFLSSQGRPNLLWQSFTTQPSPAVSGQPVQVTAVVRNNGVVDSAASTAILVDATSATDELVAGPLQIDTMAAGDSLELNFFLDTSGLSGERQLLLRLDPDLLIDEINELDNESAVPLFIEPTLSGIDAAIFSTEFELDPATIGSLPVSVQLSVRVRNLGDQTANGLTLALIDNRSNGHVELQRTTLDLPPAGQELVTLDLDIQTRPVSTFSIVLDPDNLLSEVNENNNQIDFSIPSTDGVDLDVGMADIIINPQPAIVGSDNALQVIFRNVGTTDAPPASALVLEHFDGQTRTLLDTITQLPAGGSDVRMISWRPLQTGEHQIEVLLDQDNVIAETDESNNTNSVIVNVDAAILGNLMIDSWQAMPDPASEGASVDLLATIRNGGSGINTDISYSIYSGDPQQGGELLENNQILGGLGSGTVTSISFLTDPLSGAANRIFVIQLDPADLISESDESDNQTFIEVSVLSLPDLLVTPAAVSLSPAAPVPGQPVTATINISNLGMQPSGAFALTVEDVEVNGDFSLVAAPVSASNIPGGASASAQVTWIWPDDRNISHLRIAVDSGDEVSESDEANNIITRAVTTQPGDLYLTEMFISPDGNGVQDTTSITFSLTDPDNLNIQIVAPSGEVVRVFGPFTQTTQSSVIWDGRGNDGRIVDDEDYSVRLIGSAGIRAISTVTVDTNRYPIYRAIGTPREHIELLGCEVESKQGSQVRFSIDGERLFISNPDNPFNGDDLIGIFSIPTLGRGAQNVISEQWLENLADQDGFDQSITEFHILENNDILFVTSRRNIGSSSNHKQRLWIQNTRSGSTRELNYTSLQSTNIIDVISEDAVLVRTTQSNPSIVRHMLVDINGVNPAQQLDAPELSLYYLGASRDGFLLTESDKSDLDSSDPPDNDRTGIWFIPYDPSKVFQEIDSPQDGDIEYIDLSDNGRYLAVMETISGLASSSAGVYIYDLYNPFLSPVSFDASDVGGASDLTMQWSPAANMLYIVNRHNGRIHKYDQAGNILRTYDLPDLSVFDAIISQFNGSYISEGGVAINQPGAFCPADADYKVALNDELRPPIYEGFRSVTELSPLLFSPDGSDALLAVNAIDEAAIEGCLKVTLSTAFYKLSSDDDELAYMPELSADFYKVCTDSDPTCLSGVELQSSDINASTWLLPSDGVIEFFDIGSSTSIDPLIAQLSPEVYTTSSNDFEVHDVYPRVSGLVTKQLRYRGPVPNEREECGLLSGYQDWSSLSLDNVVAHLEARFENGLFILSGIAADRHLHNYRLEWASVETPDQRSVLLPPQPHEVVDEVMTFWSPPQAGVFNVHLTVSDQAGNRSSDIVSVSSSESASISSISGSPAYISPNGDGVSDQYQIHFRVFQPLVVNVLIADGSGMTVRNITENIVSPTGELMSVIWDGRDDDGILVADGAYTVTVNDRPLFVTVDTQPPQLINESIDYGYDGIVRANGPGSLSAKLSARILDANSGQFKFELQLPASNDWITVDDGGFPCIFQSSPIPCASESLPVEIVSGTQARIIATDDAGNQALVNIPPAEPELLLLGSANIDSVNGDDFDLLQTAYLTDNSQAFFDAPNANNTGMYAVSNLPLPADSITMEFSNDGDAWFELPISQLDQDAAESGLWGFQHPSGNDPFWNNHHVLLWESANYPQFQSYSIRLRAVSSQGEELMSNVVELGNVLSSGIVGQQVPEPVWARNLLNQASAALPPTPKNRIRLWLSGFSELQPADNIVLSVSSNSDPRYLVPVNIAPVTIQRTIDNERHRFVAVFEVPIECLLDYAADFSSRLRLIAGDVVTLREQSHFSDTCGFSVNVGPDFAKACGSSALDQVIVDTLFEPSESARLDAIIIRRALPNGVGDVLISDTSPGPASNSYVLDTSLLPLGQHALLVTAVLDNGDELTQSANFLVQDEVPDFAIVSPQVGERICLDSDIIDLSAEQLALPVEGFIAGTQPYTYRISLQSAGSTAVFGLLDDDGGPGPNGAAESGIKLNASDDCDPVSEPDCRLQVNSSGSDQGNLGVLRRDLDNLLANGQFHAIMSATNWSGALACVDHPFELDADVNAGAPVISRNVISPNADGDFDDTVISLFTAEPLLISAQLFNAQRASNGSFVPIGSALENLFDALPASGEFQYVWNGIGPQGAYADGDYIVQLTLMDDCGFTRNDNVVIAVDNTGPEVLINFPQADSELSTVIEVLGTVSDVHLDRYRLAFRETGASGSGATLATGEHEVVNDFLGFWNLSGLLGPYELLLTAVDEVNNSSETSVTIDINELGSLIFAFDAQPRKFSPDGNGVLDGAVATLGLLANADVDISVVDGFGNSIRQLLDSNLQSGSHQVVWNGLNNSGSVVADGRYDITVLASNGGQFQDEMVSVVVDNTPPLIQLIHPQGEFSDGAGALSVQFDDANFSGYQIYRSPQPDAPASQLVIQGDMAGMVDALNLSILGEGVYSVRALALDQAGNESLLERTFSIDRTPPQVDMLTPLDGSFLSIQAGPVPIQGQFSDLNFSAYTIDIRSAGTADTWQNLFSGNELPSTSLLFEWDLGVPDGAYELRLQVTDLAGNVRTDTVTITIDNSAPVVALTAPEDGAVIGPVTQILGQASDLNLRSYRVSLSPANSNPPLWSDFIAGDQSVLDGILGAFTALPADGDYQLRLLAEDRASNTAAIIQTVTVDATAPATPQNLDAQLAQGGAVELNWNPVSDADLAGYRLFRDGAVIAMGVTNASSFTDTGAADGEHVYHVAAVDILGNQSPLSNPAVVQIDTTPPIVILLAPDPGSRHAGNVAVRASAYGDDDLANYRLYLAADGQTLPGDLLTQSGVPVNASVIFSLDTTLLISESTYQLTLIAEDLTANQAQVTVQIVVDNTAPAAPTGLQASLDQDTVTLTWAANAESDLLGYLLLRNGVLVNGPAMSDDLRPLALADSNFVDIGLPDGEHIYAVLAIDTAGNISAPSSTVGVVVEQGPPELHLLRPDDGIQFDGPLQIAAGSADLDIAGVIFEYRPAAGGDWIMIGNIDTLSPFEANLDPTGLDRGFYQIRGLATDQGGLSDPTPPVVTVEHRDLNPPPAVAQVSALVTGSNVVLSWAAVSADDLAGYHIDRIRDATTVRITGSALTTTNFTDTGLADGVYSYQVIAVDDSDNESSPSVAVSAQVTTPRLDVGTPLEIDTSITVTGFAEVQGNADLTVQPSGYSDTQAIMDDGAFSFSDVPLNVGDNQLEVVINYASNNVSNTATAVITQAQPPSAPTGLQAAVNDQQITLSWNPNPEPDIAGYQVFSGTNPMIHPAVISGIITEATVNTASASNSTDGDFNTFWQVFSDSLLGGAPQSIRFDLPQPEIVNDLTLQWQRSTFDAAFPPQHFKIQAMFNGIWQTLAELDSNSLGRHTVLFEQAIMTDQIRVVLFGLPQTANVVRLYEAGLSRVGLTAATSYDVGTMPNGSFEFTLTARNENGLESELSEPVTAMVGDFTAPAPVTLAAQVIDSDVQLSWNASQAADLSHYQLYRGAESIAMVNPPETLFVDSNLAGGEYGYTVTVVDLAGNESELSNMVTVTIQADAPEPPVNLIVVAPPGGNVLELSWTNSPSPNVVRYNVSRSLQSGGPYVVLASVDAPKTSYQDTSVIPGQAYFYVLQASDAPGNLSAFSNEASATPIDSETPQPPVITFPTDADEPIQVESPIIAVAGSAEPDVRVDLRNNNQLVGSSQALADYSVMEAPLATSVESDNVLLSPDGRWLFVSDFPVDRLLNIENGQEIALTTRSGFGQWSEDALTFFVRSDDRSEVLAYELSTQQQAILYSAVEINAFAVSPDRTRLFVAGIHNTGAGMVEGVWVTDLITGALTMFTDVGRFFVNRNTVRWSPDAEYIGFTYNEFGNELYVVNELGELQTSVSLGSGGGSIPEWRPGGDGLLVVARNAMFREQVLFLAEPFASVMPETLTVESEVDHTMPSWSPDGNSLAWQRRDFIGEDEIVHIIDIFDFPQREVTTSITTEQFQLVVLRWLNNGTIRGLDYESRLDVEQPGRFVIEQALLNVGSNEFIATAVDGAGNQSFGSAPVIVTYLPQNQADLVLDTLSVLPATANPNQNLSVNLSIANQGSVDAEALFGVRLVDDFNNTIIQLPTTSLGQVPAGDAISGSVTLPAPGAAAAYRVIVTADPGNQIAELDETNNTDVADIAVVDDGPPTLMLNLGQTTVLAGGLLTGVASVFNPGNTVDLRLLLSVEDRDNVLVENLPAIEIDDLFFAESRMLPFAWDSMQTFAGDYHMRARLVNSSSSLITEQIVPFTLIDDAQITIQVGTDQVQYETGGTVLIASNIDYVQGNTPIDGGQLRLHAFAVDGVEVYSEVIMLGRLLPGDQTEIVERWSLDGLAVGDYNIVAGVFIDGTEAANNNSVITVNPASSNEALAGTVTLATPSVAHGSPIQTSFEITNVGDTSVQGELFLELVATGQSGVLDQHISAINLEIGAVLTGDHDFFTDALTPGAYSILLRAQLGAESSLLDVVNLNVVDAEAPVISIVSPAQDAVMGAEVLFRVIANDGLSAIDNVRISVDGGAPRNMALGANGEYNSSFVLADGNHLFAITATDTAGNSASVDGDFVVDTAPPAITITGVSDGLLTNQPPVTPVIAIVDDHLQSSSIVLNNQSYLSATPITADGDYVLLVSAVDEAGNSNSATRSFTIDTVGPELALISPESGSVVTTSSVDIEVLSETDVSVSLHNEFGDTFLESTDATGHAIFMAVPLNAGDNNISMQATDMATNVGAVNNFVLTLDADPVAAVSGGLQIPESNPFIPRPIRVNYSVVNAGNVPFSDLPIRLQLINSLNQNVAAVHAIQEPLEVNETISESLLFTTEGLEPGDYLMVLQADIEAGIPTELGSIPFSLAIDESVIFMDGFEDFVPLTQSPLATNTNAVFAGNADENIMPLSVDAFSHMGEEYSGKNHLLHDAVMRSRHVKKYPRVLEHFHGVGQ